MKKLNALFVLVVLLGALIPLLKPAPVLAWGLAPSLDLPGSIEGCSETYSFSGTLNNPNGWGATVELEVSEDSTWIQSVSVSSEGHVGPGATININVVATMEEGWAGRYGESEYLTISAFFRADGCGNISPGAAATIAVVNTCEPYEPCEECAGDRVVEIPEAERGEWDLYDTKPDGTKVYRRPLTRDRYTGVICSWEYKTVEPCIRCNVDVITWGGWPGITNTLSVGGTDQPSQFTGLNSSWEAQTTWFFWPPPGARWNIEAEAGNPPGKDPSRWQTRFIGIKKGGPFDDKPIIPGEPVTDIGPCERVTFYFQLLDTWALEPPDPPDPPDDPPQADPPVDPPDPPLDPPADPPDDPEPAMTHTVVEGECLWSIWEDLGRPTGWGEWLKTVTELNELDNPDLLSIGQVLVLPG